MKRRRHFFCSQEYGAWIVFCCIFLLVIGISTAPCFSQPTDSPKKILLIPSYNFDYKGIQWFNKGVEEGFAEQDSNIPVVYSIENLQLAAHPGDETYFSTMAESLRIRYAKDKPDLIIAQYKQSVQFMLRYGQQIFGDVPVVFAGLELEGYGTLNFPANYTGVTTSFNAKRNIELILQLHPETQTIYVITGVGSTEKDMLDNTLTQGLQYRDRLKFVALDQLPFERMLASVAQIKGDAAIIYLSMQIDSQGKILVPAAVARDLGRVANVPVYGMLDTYVGSGITGGFLINHEKLGRRAAAIAGNILRGTQPSNIPVENESIGEYSFDWNQLQRWKVPEAKLPPDSKLDFKKIGVWELYKWELLGGIVFLLLQSLLLITLLVNRSFRKKSEAVIRESEERYRALLEQSSDAIAIVDVDSLRILEVNRRWTEMMGYSAEEARKLSIYNVDANIPEHIDAVYQNLLLQNHLPHGMIRLRRKGGRTIEVERSGAVIQYSGKKVFMISNRDISEERKLQALLGKDVSLAADVQRSLIPGNFEDVLVSVKTIYVPHHLVSGDFYDFAWSQEHKRFSGFIVDISGHGVGSSLQGIAVSAYFREVLESQMNLTSKLKWINQHVLRYFTDETYAAAIYFEFDFIRKTLSFATAGVYGFLAHNAALPSIVKKAGSLIGISDNPEYTEWLVPIQTGDTFYFMSDGLFDQLNDKKPLAVDKFEQTVEILNNLAQGPTRRDDCCAVCVRVSGKPSFPVNFDFCRPGEYSRIRSRVRDLFYQLAGKDAGRINVVVGEALNNAAREAMDVKVKINLIGNRLVVRVKDGGDGFDGNARVAAFVNAAKQDVVFEERQFAEGGRGILIMVSWLDRVIYNQKGNEVLLMKRLPKLML